MKANSKTGHEDRSSEVHDNFQQYKQGTINILLTFKKHSKYPNLRKATILDNRIWSSDPGYGRQVER